MINCLIRLDLVDFLFINTYNFSIKLILHILNFKKVLFFLVFDITFVSLYLGLYLCLVLNDYLLDFFVDIVIASLLVVFLVFIVLSDE